MSTLWSIGGYCFTLGLGVISWSSKKQPTVADSSCYAEYITLHSTAHEVIFLRQLLEGLKVLPPHTTNLFCNNNASSRLSEDHIWHSHTKHIRVKYHYTCELVHTGDITISQVGSRDNTTDILTKDLARMDFQWLQHQLGMQVMLDSSLRWGGYFEVGRRPGTIGQHVAYHYHQQHHHVNAEEECEGGYAM